MKLLPGSFSLVCSFSIRHCLGSCHCGLIFLIMNWGHTSLSWAPVNVSCPLATHCEIDGTRANLSHKPTLSSLQQTQLRAMEPSWPPSLQQWHVMYRKEFLRKSFLFISAVAMKALFWNYFSCLLVLLCPREFGIQHVSMCHFILVCVSCLSIHCHAQNCL